MARFPSHRRGWITVAAGAVQTIVAAVAAADWLGSGGIAAASALFGSWAALALVLMISSGAADAIAAFSSAAERPIGDQALPEPDPRIAPTLKLGALLPVCQIAVGAAIAALASLGGFAVAESVLLGPGIGGATATMAAIAGGAYLALLCGALLALITVVPSLMLWRAARRGAPDSAPKRSRVPTAAMAIIVLAVFPLAVGTVQGVAEPGGSPRAAAYALLLTVLGFDLSDEGYTVQHWGWLWTARICGAVILVAVAATLLARRSARQSAEARRSR
ncbi:hypothetical protein [Glycomyces sp. YM15]|uniref:hypothetical protein n=1 Tax=Glycomyces sp. YM15 TaxID=2800446 RepID=UPI001965AF41|nr:hypothetical protein [Glycomyces sp. YM15]